MHYLWLALFIFAFVMVITGKIMFIIAAFRASAVWGLCVIFLQGIADFLFLILHWEEAKKPFGIQMLGVLLGFAAIFSGALSGLGNGSGSTMEQLAQQLATSEIAAELQQKAEQEYAQLQDAPQAPAAEASPSAPSKDDPRSFVGAPLSQARSALGRPKGEMKSGGEICWLYDTFSVFSADGVTVSHIEMGDKSTGSSKGAKRRSVQTRQPSAPAEQAVRVIANGGQQIDLKTVLVPGKITVVDFYADWCAPCRQMGPQLEQIALTDPNVVLRKIDIVNWETPIVQQFGIRSIPNVRVYNPKGAAVGNPTSGLDEIKRNIERAR